MLKRNYKDIVGGLLFVLLGLYVLITAFDFGIGSAQRMGAGYYPMFLGASAIGLGALIMMPAFREPASVPRIAWKPFIAVIGGLTSFLLLADWLGLVPAIWALVGISAMADEDITPRGAIALMAALSFALWLLFRVALRLPIPAFTWPA